MPRRRVISKREVPADPLYASPLVTRFINTVMRGGKRSTAEAIFYRSFDISSDPKQTLAKRQYKLAAAQFDEVERQHPYSVWARRAQLMSAFSYYVAGDFTQSVSSAQRFSFSCRACPRDTWAHTPSELTFRRDSAIMCSWGRSGRFSNRRQW